MLKTSAYLQNTQLTVSLKILSCVRQVCSSHRNKPSGPTFSNMSQVNKVKVALDPELCPHMGLANRFHRLSSTSKYMLLLLLNTNSLRTHHLLCDKIITLDHCATVIFPKYFLSRNLHQKVNWWLQSKYYWRKSTVAVNAKNCQSQREKQSHHIVLLGTVKIQLNFFTDLKVLKNH